MENKVVVNMDHLLRENEEAHKRGMEIESFNVYEIYLMPDGSYELGPISDIKYKEIRYGNVRT